MSHETGTPMTPQHDWLLRSRALLERSTDEFDASTLSRLNRARQAALDTGPTASRPSRWLAFAGTAAVAAGLLLVVARGVLPGFDAASVPPATEFTAAVAPAIPAMSPPPAMTMQPRTPVAEPDFDLLLDTEQLQLLEELEFYTWLDAETEPGG